MKTELSFYLPMSVFFICMVLNSFAQENSKSYSALKIGSYEISKYVSVDSNRVLGKNEITYVNPKVLRNFIREFHNAGNVRWFRVKDYILAISTQMDLPTRTLFDKEGYIVYSISLYSEKQLPFEIRDLIKRKYYDYNIDYVWKATDDNHQQWTAKMENDLSYVTVLIEDRGMEEVANLLKAH